MPLLSNLKVRSCSSFVFGSLKLWGCCILYFVCSSKSDSVFLCSRTAWLLLCFWSWVCSAIFLLTFFLRLSTSFLMMIAYSNLISSESLRYWIRRASARSPRWSVACISSPLCSDSCLDLGFLSFLVSFKYFGGSLIIPVLSLFIALSSWKRSASSGPTPSSRSA